MRHQLGRRRSSSTECRRRARTRRRHPSDSCGLERVDASWGNTDMNALPKARQAGPRTRINARGEPPWPDFARIERPPERDCPLSRDAQPTLESLRYRAPPDVRFRVDAWSEIVRSRLWLARPRVEC